MQKGGGKWICVWSFIHISLFRFFFHPPWRRGGGSSSEGRKRVGGGLKLFHPLVMVVVNLLHAPLAPSYKQQVNWIGACSRNDNEHCQCVCLSVSVSILPSGFIFFIYTDVTNKQTPRPLLIFWKIEKYIVEEKNITPLPAPYITVLLINYHFVYIFFNDCCGWVAGWACCCCCLLLIPPLWLELNC